MSAHEPTGMVSFKVAGCAHPSAKGSQRASGLGHPYPSRTCTYFQAGGLQDSRPPADDSER